VCGGGARLTYGGRVAGLVPVEDVVHDAARVREPRRAGEALDEAADQHGACAPHDERAVRS
jgi:hypothetical protein